jgi:hypothetical protein
MLKAPNKGLSYSRNIFGDDSEKMLSRLFMMRRHPRNRRRPDLISEREMDGYRLTLEVKTGRRIGDGAKGVMVDSQLHYAINSARDYGEVFGKETRNQKQRLLFEIEDFRATEDRNVAYYYDVVIREDDLKADDLKKPYSSIRFDWGDQHIVPNDFAFWMFALERSRKTGETVRDSVRYLYRLMREDYLNGTRQSRSRKLDENSWQNLCSKDIRAIFKDEESLTTKLGRERIKVLGDNYDLQSLKRICIDGPNKTKIYVLTKEEHVELFNQLSQVVKRRKDTIERVSEERSEARELLEKIKQRIYVQERIDGESSKTRVEFDLKRLKRSEIETLQRLENWLTKEEAA